MNLEELFAKAGDVKLSEGELKQVWANIAEFQVKNHVRDVADGCLDDGMEKRNALLQAYEKVQLTPQELADSHGRIRAFMLAHPIVSVARSTGWSFVTARFHSIVFRPVFAAFLIMLMGAGGTVSYAAESALPGDVLYPVKVKFNEHVRERMLFSTRAKTEFDIERAERRLQEVEQITARGVTDPSMRLELANRLRSHIVGTREHFRQLAKEDESAVADLSSQFEAKLIMHQAVLVELANVEADDQKAGQTATAASVESMPQATIRIRQIDRPQSLPPALVHMMNAIEQAKRETKQARRQAEVFIFLGQPGQVRVTVGTNVSAAAEQISAARDIVASKKRTFDKESADSATARLDEAQEATAKAERKLEQQSFDEAFTLARQARHKTEQAKMMLKVEEALSTDTNISPQRKKNAVEKIRQKLHSAVQEEDSDDELQSSASSSLSSEIRLGRTKEGVSSASSVSAESSASASAESSVGSSVSGKEKIDSSAKALLKGKVKVKLQKKD